MGCNHCQLIKYGVRWWCAWAIKSSGRYKLNNLFIHLNGLPIRSFDLHLINVLSLFASHEIAHTHTRITSSSIFSFRLQFHHALFSNQIAHISTGTYSARLDWFFSTSDVKRKRDGRPDQMKKKHRMKKEERSFVTVHLSAIKYIAAFRAHTNPLAAHRNGKYTGREIRRPCEWMVWVGIRLIVTSIGGNVFSVLENYP